MNATAAGAAANYNPDLPARDPVAGGCDSRGPPDACAGVAAPGGRGVAGELSSGPPGRADRSDSGVEIGIRKDRSK